MPSAKFWIPKPRARLFKAGLRYPRVSGKFEFKYKD